jgi:hypothetical protein
MPICLIGHQISWGLVNFANLKNVDLDFVEAKLPKVSAAWSCGSATSGGRLILLQSCLTGIPL